MLIPFRTDSGSWPPLTGLRDHTRTTLGRTPLDERDFYLTLQNAHKRKNPCPRRDFLNSNASSLHYSYNVIFSYTERSDVPTASQLSLILTVLGYKKSGFTGYMCVPFTLNSLLFVLTGYSHSSEPNASLEGLCVYVALPTPSVSHLIP